MTEISLSRYTFWFFVFRILVPVITFLIRLRTGIDVTFHGFLVTMLPVVLASFIVGRRFKRQNLRAINRSEARRFAFAATARVFVVDLLVTFGFPLVLGRPEMVEAYIFFFTGEYAGFFISLAVIALSVAFILNWWAVRLASRVFRGAKNIQAKVA